MHLQNRTIKIAACCNQPNCPLNIRYMGWLFWLPLFLDPSFTNKLITRVSKNSDWFSEKKLLPSTHLHSTLNTENLFFPPKIKLPPIRYICLIFYFIVKSNWYTLRDLSKHSVLIMNVIFHEIPIQLHWIAIKILAGKSDFSCSTWNGGD